jgi:hypothetical protein
MDASQAGPDPRPARAWRSQISMLPSDSDRTARGPSSSRDSACRRGVAGELGFRALASLLRGLRQWTAARSVAEWFRRGFSARGCACRGVGARKGVEDFPVSSGDGRRRR